MSNDIKNNKGESFVVELDGAFIGYIHFNRAYSLDECNSFNDQVLLTGKGEALTSKKQTSANGNTKYVFSMPGTSRPLFWLQGSKHPLKARNSLLAGEVKISQQTEAMSMDEIISML